MVWDEMCQPCGDCDWCEHNIGARRVADSLRRRMPKIRQTLDYLKRTVLLDSDPELEHPESRRMLRQYNRIEASLNAALGKGGKWYAQR